MAVNGVHIDDKVSVRHALPSQYWPPAHRDASLVVTSHRSLAVASVPCPADGGTDHLRDDKVVGCDVAFRIFEPRVVAIAVPVALAIAIAIIVAIVIIWTRNVGTAVFASMAGEAQVSVVSSSPSSHQMAGQELG